MNIFKKRISLQLPETGDRRKNPRIMPAAKYYSRDIDDHVVLAFHNTAHGMIRGRITIDIYFAGGEVVDVRARRRRGAKVAAGSDDAK